MAPVIMCYLLGSILGILQSYGIMRKTKRITSLEILSVLCL